MSFRMELFAEKSKIKYRSLDSDNSSIENEEKFKLSYAFQNLTKIGIASLPKDKEQILILDLTENNFFGSNDLKFLSEFPKLKTLVLDKNQIQSNIRLPLMKNLTTLWVNHNKIENLTIFIQNLAETCPDLEYLSMMNNKAAPSYFNGGSIAEYNDYRLYVISKLNKLKMLDYKQITSEERAQSQSIYGITRASSKTNKKSDKINKKPKSKKVNSENSSEKNINKKEMIEQVKSKDENIQEFDQNKQNELIANILPQIDELKLDWEEKISNKSLDLELDLIQMTKKEENLDINQEKFNNPPSPSLSMLIDLEYLPALSEAKITNSN